jgi:hypothetical protein
VPSLKPNQMKKLTYSIGCLAIAICVFPIFISAQPMVSGRVMSGSESIPFANVLLYQLPDSVLVKGQITAADGSFTFHALPTAVFFLQISSMGYEKFQSPAFQIIDQKDKKEFGSINLKEQSATLQEVAVVAKKPIFEQRLDRLVIHVKDNIGLVGASALEVLERSPGVVVNRQNNTISLAGKDGVVVMLNGKVTYMPLEAVVQMLSTLSADQIDKLEILSTPPANLDAEGNAGYINIVMKKQEDEGLNGSVSASVGYGKGEIGNFGLNMNHQKGKLNVFGGYTYLRSGQLNPMTFYRSVKVGDDILETNTFSDRRPTRNNHNMRIGADYTASKKTTIGMLVTAYDTKWEMDASNLSETFTNTLVDTVTRVQSYEINQWRHLGTNLNVQHTLRQGESLSFDADYLYYHDHNPVDYANRVFFPGNQLVRTNEARSRKNTPINIGVSKLDYVKSLRNDAKIELGVKASMSRFSNDVSVEDFITDQWLIQDALTANYHLNELIYAAYASTEFKLTKKMSGKLGLRYEYTDSNLGSNEEANIIDREYGQLFPSAFLSYAFNDKTQSSVSYSRRITRPTFNELAPFVIFVDPTTFFAGNSALQPAFSNTLKLDIKHGSSLITVQYSVEDSTIARFQSRVEPGTNHQYSTSTNLKQQRIISVAYGQSFAPVTWWRSYTNLTTGHQSVDFYLYDNELLTVNSFNLSLFSSQTFTLAQTVNFELSGFVNAGGLFGTARNEPFGSLNAGLQKKFKKGDALSIGYDNFLNTMVFKGSFDIPQEQQYFRARLQFSHPTIKVSYSKPFGNSKVRNASKRNMGSIEEQKRVDG